MRIHFIFLAVAVSTAVVLLVVFFLFPPFEKQKFLSPQETLKSSYEQEDIDEREDDPSRVLLQLAFVEDLKTLVDSSKGKWGISVISIKDGVSFGVNQDKLFPAASTMKVLVAANLLKRVQDEEFKLDYKLPTRKAKMGEEDEKKERQVEGEKIEEELGEEKTLEKHGKLMVKRSDNDSWETLSVFLGYKKLDDFAKSLGLEHLDVYKNLITASDLSLLLLKLYKGEILNENYTQKLLSWMRETETEDRIPKVLPKGVIFYHKTGTFNGIIHDAAIIIHQENPFILSVLSEDNKTRKDGIEMIQNITKKVWEFEETI